MPIDESGYWVPPDTVYLPELEVPHPETYMYRDLIPEATTQTPGELLNNHYGDKANVRDWTDPNGVLRCQQETFRNFPQYTALPIGSSGLIGRWPRPQSLRAVPVQVHGMGTVTHAQQAVVEFRNRNQGGPSKGIPLSPMLEGRSEVLEDASDIVLDNVRTKDLTFIISWVGYRVQASLIHIRRKTDGEPLTRFELARKIAIAYAYFFRRVNDECLLPTQVGFFNIALHQGKYSKHDSLGVQLHQLRLVRFREGPSGYWVADVEIV